MIFDVFSGLVMVLCLAVSVYMICLALEEVAAALLDEAHEDDPLKVTASELGREAADNHGNFQDRYYFRILEVSGTIAGIKVLPAANGQHKHQVELDGAVRCEFSGVPGELQAGMSVSVRGLCMGRVLTGCEVREAVSSAPAG